MLISAHTFLLKIFKRSIYIGFMFLYLQHDTNRIHLVNINIRYMHFVLKIIDQEITYFL